MVTNLRIRGPPAAPRWTCIRDGAPGRDAQLLITLRRYREIGAMVAILTVREASLRLGVSAATVYGLCAACRLRHSRVGMGRGKIRIPEDAVDEYLKAREVGPRKPVPPLLPRPRPVTLKYLDVN